MHDQPEIFDNRYEIIKRLGSGGMADVYLARDTHLGREVAIKILYKRYARDEEFVARFRREAQAAAGLNHPHIVSIYDRGEAEGSYYIAMEYLDGESLKDVIAREGKIPPQRAIGIAEQILQALQFAHEHNVIHRDIKPHNIIINGRGQVKVTDFGIARAGTSAKMTETGSILGTAQYLSPEQAKGKAVEQSSDLYSLGVVLYEMLTGRVPFEGENPVAIALKHLSDEPEPPQAINPEIPDNLNAVVMKALAKDPRDRYGDAEQFLADLERCRQNLPVAPLVAIDETARTSVIRPAAAAMMEDLDATRATTVQPRPAAASERKSSRKNWIYVLILLAALALAAVGVYLLAFSQQGSVEVPNVVGMDRGQAEDTIKKAGLKPEIEAEEFNENVPAGKVIRQNPEAGAKLKKNGTVRLVLSKGSNKVAVPGGLVGQSASFVEAKLKEAGLNPERQPDAYSDTIEQGNVISVDPPSGTLVQKGSTVKYTVSKGPAPPKEVTVPDVSGLTIPEASARLEQAGLKLGSTTEQFSDSVPTGMVISQSPAAGQKVKEGSTVNITVSKGPQKNKVSVPYVIDMNQSTAVSTLSAAGLLTTVTEVVTADPTKVGKVISQNPASGTLVDEGSTVSITVGKSP